MTRGSDHSNQKLGEGIYFSLSAASLRAFAATPGAQPTKTKLGYEYLLEVELPFAMTDFVDLRADPNAITRWWTQHCASNSVVPSVANQTTFKQQVAQFCTAHGKVGLIWQAAGAAWDELLVLSGHIGAGFLIRAASAL